MRGVKKSPETIARMKAAQKGKAKSQETKEKISQSLKGRKMPWVAEQNRKRVYSESQKHARSRQRKLEWKKGIRKSGYKHSDEARKHNADAHRGEKAYNWKSDRTFRLQSMQFRSSPENREWRNQVFKRDEYTCQECGARGVYLEPHHIIPLKVDWDKKTEINNGITLCRPCHQKTLGKEEKFAARYTLVITSRLTTR